MIGECNPITGNRDWRRLGLQIPAFDRGGCYKKPDINTDSNRPGIQLGMRVLRRSRIRLVLVG